MTDLPYLDRAELLLELGRHPEAEQLLRVILGAYPESASAMAFLAVALRGQHRHAEAVDAARTSVTLSGGQAEALRLLADCLREAGRSEEGLTPAQQAVRLAPLDWRNHYALGRLELESPHPAHADALRRANEVVRLAPHESAGHTLAGLALDRLGRSREARTAYAEALRLDPTNAMALNNVAATEFEAGRLHSASLHLRSGLGSDPHLAELHQNYHAVLLRLIFRLRWGLLVGFFALAVPVTSGAAYRWRVLLGLGLGLIGFLVIHRTTRALPARAQMARELFPRSTPLQRWWLTLFAVQMICLIVMALAPSDAAVIAFLLCVAAFVAGAVVNLAAWGWQGLRWISGSSRRSN